MTTHSNKTPIESTTATIECLHELFEQQVQLVPTQTALIYKDETLTYLQLDQKANQLAHLLLKLNIGLNDRVAILVDRNDFAYLAMLAILKIGATYVPLDPDYPRERINYILKDCHINLLITLSQLIENKSLNYNQIALDQVLENLNSFSQKKPKLTKKPSGDHSCYIIYTSGSTGKPKGVELTHRGVCNYVQSAKNIYALNHLDRVYQGFSIAFDASVEEIWLTLSAGATLIPAPNKALRAGAGLLDFLNTHQITFFSTIPTLLKLLEPNIPSLKVLILGGEICPQDLVTRWYRPGLRIINTYGPTEASVVTSYAECHPNKPITIGKPLPNYEVLILNSELEPVGIGEEGELCISGISLARGYINQPELNQKKFIFHPKLGNKRFYRTGDLACQLEDHEFQFRGRIDNQIKLRGFRIEPSEIENVIMEYPKINHAVITVCEHPIGTQALIAYISIDKELEFSIKNLRNFLRARLAAYMMPNQFEIIDQFPLLPSGKIDRKNLPLPNIGIIENNENYIPARNETEQIIVTVWEKIFNQSSISIADDFFYDLGGHSLLAANAVTLLRQMHEFEHVSMLDIYQNPTIETLAAKLDLNKQNETDLNAINEEQKIQEKSGWKYYIACVLQMIGCYFQFALLSWEYLFTILLFGFVINKYSLYSFQTIGAFTGIIIFFPIIMFALVIAAKWLLLGKVKPGEYKLWGGFYLRWWLIQRLQRAVVPLNHLSGTPLMNLYCRLMGAKIGKNCYLGTDHIDTFDLLTIGDNASINQHAAALGYTVENKHLKIGSISIGKDCYIGIRAVLNLNTQMGDGSSLEDLSMLPEKGIISPQQHYHGSPARPKDIKTNYAQNADTQAYHSAHALYAGSSPTTSTTTNIFYGLLHYFGLLFIMSIYYAAFIPGALLVTHFYYTHNYALTLLAVPIGSFLFIVLFFSCVILIKKILIGKIKPGIYKIKSWFYVRKWIVDHCINYSEIEVMAESLYFPYFMRMLGAKIGKRVEIADLPSVNPDLFEIKDESFTTGSVIVAYGQVNRGYVKFGYSSIGKRTFVGNTAVIPPDTHLGDNCLLGCVTISPPTEKASKPNNAWLGSPPFYLPKRQILSGFTESQIYTPPRYLYFVRGCFELIRIILPTCFYFLMFIGLIISVDFLYQRYSLITTFLLFPLVEIILMAILGSLAIALKWSLMGKFKPTIKPLWHIFIWKSDLLERLHNVFIGRFILEPLLGTPYASFVLRLLGVKIGKRAFIDSSRGFAEYDLIQIGDDVALNADCTMLTHLFEDRILKMDKIVIGNNCSIGSCSEVIYDTVMEENSILGSLSLLMKGEHLPPNSHWEGIPSQKNQTQSCGTKNFSYNAASAEPG